MKDIEKTILTICGVIAALLAFSQMAGCVQELGAQTTQEKLAVYRAQQAQAIADKARSDLHLELLRSAERLDRK